MQYKTTYIYGLKEKGEELYRYIGKSVNPKKRFQSHKDYARNKPTTYTGCWIKSLLSEEKEVEMDILDECEGDSWINRETELIFLFRSAGALLTNHTNGGENPPNLGELDEERKKTIYRKRSENYYKKKEQGFKRNFNWIPSEETKRIIIKNLTSRQVTVDQYTLDGKYIKTWYKLIDIKNDLGIQPANISKVCKGTRNHAGGFNWKLVETKIVKQCNIN
jgi:Zn-finger nucleic acid-binding protein